jgi:putative endonuclease
MKIFTSKRQKTGLLGEKAAEAYIVKQGFSVIDRNYSTRFGEIDIIAERDKRLYFFEVKTVSCETKQKEGMISTAGSRETFLRENRKLKNPFQNISYFKIKRLTKTAEIYLRMKNISSEVRWQIDGVGVYLDHVSREPYIERIENISIF